MNTYMLMGMLCFSWSIMNSGMVKEDEEVIEMIPLYGPGSVGPCVRGDMYYKGAQAFKVMVLSIARMKLQQQQSPDRIYLTPSDQLVPRAEQTLVGMFLEVEHVGRFHLITPWGKWQFARSSSVIGKGDEKLQEELLACKSLQLTLSERRYKKLSDGVELPVSKLYTIHRIENNYFSPAQLQERHNYRKPEEASESWEQMKLLYGNPQ